MAFSFFCGQCEQNHCTPIYLHAHTHSHIHTLSLTGRPPCLLSIQCNAIYTPANVTPLQSCSNFMMWFRMHKFAQCHLEQWEKVNKTLTFLDNIRHQHQHDDNNLSVCVCVGMQVVPMHVTTSKCKMERQKLATFQNCHFKWPDL